MSSKNNVNKDFYTLAGRDRPNELVVEAATTPRPDELPGRGHVRSNFIPGAAPVGESPAPVDETPTPAPDTPDAKPSAPRAEAAPPRRAGKTKGGRRRAA